MLDSANRRAPAIQPRDPNVTDPKDRQRLSGQNARFYRLLSSRDRVTNVELARIALKYTSRISDLREVGCIITCDPVPGRPGVHAYSMRDPRWEPRPGFCVTAHRETREVVGVRFCRRGRVWVLYKRPRELGVVRCLLGSWRAWATPIERPDVGMRGWRNAAARSQPKRKARG